MALMLLLSEWCPMGFNEFQTDIFVIMFQILPDPGLNVYVGIELQSDWSGDLLTFIFLSS